VGMVTRKITSFTATSKITYFPGCCYKGVLEVIETHFVTISGY
jgi:hypothetical protein